MTLGEYKEASQPSPDTLVVLERSHKGSRPARVVANDRTITELAMWANTLRPLFMQEDSPLLFCTRQRGRLLQFVWSTLFPVMYGICTCSGYSTSIYVQCHVYTYFNEMYILHIHISGRAIGLPQQFSVPHATLYPKQSSALRPQHHRYTDQDSPHNIQHTYCNAQEFCRVSTIMYIQCMYTYIQYMYMYKFSAHVNPL